MLSKQSHRRVLLIGAAVIIALIVALGVGVAVPAVNGMVGFFRQQTIEHEELSFTAGGVSGSYRIYADGVDYAEPVTLVVRLHGDGAYEYEEPDYALDEMAVVAERHNAILVAPRTPDYVTDTWWENSYDTLPWLRELLVSELQLGLGLAADDVLWIGYSGGAELLTRSLIPHMPELATGAAVMVGGGGMPYDANDTIMSDAAEVVGSLYWITGQKDDGSKEDQPWDAYSAVQVGVDYYGEYGFDISTRFPEDADHFGIDQPEVLDTVLESFSVEAGELIEPAELPTEEE